MMKLSVTQIQSVTDPADSGGQAGDTAFTPYALAYPCGRMCDLVCSQCTSGDGV